MIRTWNDFDIQFGPDFLNFFKMFKRGYPILIPLKAQGLYFLCTNFLDSFFDIFFFEEKIIF